MSGHTKKDQQYAAAVAASRRNATAAAQKGIHGQIVGGDAVPLTQVSNHAKPNCQKGIVKVNDKGAENTPYEEGQLIAKCVAKNVTNVKYKQYFTADKFWFGDDFSRGQAVTNPANWSRGKPCVTRWGSSKDIKGDSTRDHNFKYPDGTGRLRPAPLIVLHEPVTWTRAMALTSLTAACYGVHFTVDRNGEIQWHAHSGDRTNHAGPKFNNSYGIEVINKFSTYKDNGQWRPFDQWKNIEEPERKLQTIPPLFFDEAGKPRKWKSGEVRTPDNWTWKAKNWILPPEKQMEALYNLVLSLFRNSMCPRVFTGVKLSYEIYGGFYWGSLGTKENKKRKKIFTDTYSDYGGAVGEVYKGITSHAHTGDTKHRDGLFYEHYLYLRFVAGWDHVDAFKGTVDAATSILTHSSKKLKGEGDCVTYFPIDQRSHPGGWKKKPNGHPPFGFEDPGGGN